MTTSKNTKILYRGKLIELIQEEVDHLNGVRTFEFARRGPGTRILLLSPQNQILLTREYRRELNRYDTRLPGGKVFDTLAEYETARGSGAELRTFAEQAASRELLEETGYQSLSLNFIGISKCGATVEWDLYYFACTDWVEPNGTFTSHGDEDIVAKLESIDSVVKMCLRGEVTEERSAMRIIQYLHANGLIASCN